MTEISRDKYLEAFAALSDLGDQTMIYGAEDVTGRSAYDKEEQENVNADNSSYSESSGRGWERKSQEVDEALKSTFQRFNETEYDLMYYQVERKYELDNNRSSRDRKVYREPGQIKKSDQAYEALIALEAFVNERLSSIR